MNRTSASIYPFTTQCWYSEAILSQSAHISIIYNSSYMSWVKVWELTRKMPNTYSNQLPLWSKSIWSYGLKQWITPPSFSFGRILGQLFDLSVHITKNVINFWIAKNRVNNKSMCLLVFIYMQQFYIQHKFEVFMYCSYYGRICKPNKSIGLGNSVTHFTIARWSDLSQIRVRSRTFVRRNITRRHQFNVSTFQKFLFYFIGIWYYVIHDSI